VSLLFPHQQKRIRKLNAERSGLSKVDLVGLLTVYSIVRIKCSRKDAPTNPSCLDMALIVGTFLAASGLVRL
jgi:hypothetical protein